MKPLFGAVLIGIMDTRPIMLFLKDTYDVSANVEDGVDARRQAQALAYTILYDFAWENMADIRDMKEDSAEGVTTLAVSLGAHRTLQLVTWVTSIGDLCITFLPPSGLLFGWSAISQSCGRWTLSRLFLGYIAINKPRNNAFWWGLGTVVALTPAFWAQMTIP